MTRVNVISPFNISISLLAYNTTSVIKMISFNTTKYSAYTRPNNNYLCSQTPPNSNQPSKSQIYVLPQTNPNNSFSQSPQNSQKLLGSSRNSMKDMAQLSQDLTKLKEQLKRLSNQQEELMSSQINRESAIFKQVQRPKSNISSDAHIGMRKEFTYNELSYPNKPLQSYRNEVSKTNAQAKHIQSNTQQRVVPIINPNKRQSERVSNTLNSSQSRIIQPNNNPNQQQITSLRQRMANLQKELKKSRTEKQSITKELIQLKDKLKQKELQQILLTSSKNIEKEDFQKQLQMERSQHLQVVQKLYQQIDAAKKAVVLPGQQFDTALKSQIYANQQLKKQLSQQQEQVNAIKEQIQDKTNTIQYLKKQLQIQELKISADYRAKIQRLQIGLAQKDIEIQNFKRSLQTLDFRYRTSLKQLKQKDEFVMNYFVNRSSDGLKSQVSEFFKTYKAQFTTPATLQLYLKEQEQTQQLKKKLKAT